MSGPDLVAAGYPLTYPPRRLRGNAGNAAQQNISQRSNVEMLAGLNGLADTAAALASGVLTVVAVPVETGDQLSKVTVRVGATAAGTPTHSFAAVHNSAGALIAQSVDGTTTAIPASAEFTFTLASTVLIVTGTGGNAPNGFVYVALAVTAATVPSLATVSVATAVGYAWTANGPAQLCGVGGSAVLGTAPATLPTLTAQAAVPLVYVS
jgi:hypothetical protein